MATAKELAQTAREATNTATQDAQTKYGTDIHEDRDDLDVLAGAGGVSAANVTVDSTSLDGTETTVQGVFEELETQVQLAATTHAALITGTHGVVLAAPLADSSATASDVTVNADAGLSVAVAADSIYLVECFLRFTAETDGGCGLRADFTVPANSTIFGSDVGAGDTPLFGSAGSVVALDTEVAIDDIGTTWHSLIHGVLLTTDTAGNLGLSWAQKDSVDEDLIRKVGSYLQVTLIGANPA
jgi:hypothetical protein